MIKKRINESIRDKEWRKFNRVIQKAIKACTES